MADEGLWPRDGSHRTPGWDSEREAAHASERGCGTPYANRRLMNSFLHRSHVLLIASFLTGAVLTTTAQVSNDGTLPPVISKVCLWNADNTTWRSLGLRPSQIDQLDKLRKRYPAVVDGQWIGSDAEVTTPIVEQSKAVDLNVSTSISGPARPVAETETVDEARTQPPMDRTMGLQDHLRSVLTPGQLRRWAKKCSH